MKISLCLILIISCLRAAEKQPEKKPAKPAPATAVTLPAGAVEVEPNTFRYSDPEGKKWLYRKTPFGLTKFEDNSSDSNEANAPAGMTAVEDGDLIRFERPSPFGTRRWEKKKTQLNGEEQAAWKRAQQKKTARDNKEY